MFTAEQLSDDELGTAFCQVAYHAIHRGHVEAYCRMAFSKPGENSKQQQQAVAEAVLAFANLGWSAFHAMNRGQPLKDKPGAKPRKEHAVKKPKGGKGGKGK